MNTDKTQVIWLGRNKKSKTRYLRDRNFCWDPGIFRVLGVKFTTNIEQISSINYDGKIQESKKLLNTWSKRLIMSIGKITVLKSLAASKLTHLLTNLPDPSEDFLRELDKMFFEFLWNGRAHKIKKSVICRNFPDGGLRMINIYSFLSTLELSWLRRIHNEESDVRRILTSFCPNFQKVFLFGGEYVNVLIQRMDNIFWKDVLKHLEKLYGKCHVQNFYDFASESIFYNKNITVGKKTVHIRSWVNAGVGSINHLLDQQGHFFKFTDFCNEYPNIKTNFLTYNSSIRAIQTYQERKQITLLKDYKEQEPMVWRLVDGGNSGVQCAFGRTSDNAAGLQRWNEVFQNINWKKI